MLRKQLHDHAIKQSAIYREAIFRAGRSRFLPELSLVTLADYICVGIPTGGFMEALLSNNLIESARRADHLNAQKLFDWCWLLHNHTPSGSFGSPAAYAAWIKARGLQGTLSSAPASDDAQQKEPTAS